ncbi:HNH endonuclease [Novosphingobium sp. NPDC080210]|uniref:HNH endonuclease n=1 Tax=Novosphingobium sp. NPDC080210 TaxID=3390596 RepID=UPI003D020612
MCQITQQQLREQLDYDPSTGVFTWVVSRPGVARGKVAGCIQGDYVAITIHRRRYLAHRLAWLFENGHLPDEREVDHRDGDGLNNRIANLRLATRAQNGANRGVSRNSSTGHTGVSFIRSRGRFQATIGINGKNICLGQFKTLDEAVEARRLAASDMHGEFTRRS